MNNLSARTHSWVSAGYRTRNSSARPAQQPDQELASPLTCFFFIPGADKICDLETIIMNIASEKTGRVQNNELFSS